ncbi:zinc-ribbon and DUF3426 domain-containing protein [Azohydromonas caseinilytica]|uniref:DUF3426 domain-containing protein n=1 Tax=Azohydromonas caseinilytica TaxID=2728836 RepID=A0A848F736_9BURK|nr:zinc-ribbon and DUF3426 domain-containing protein [Azohydromonas caseinilytica]NML15172.1 DUF3426 domain-containing protein [Azohydromonas caseinilytica]
MSQAARCPSCRTVFRVQPQQLEASGGWARCGQCGEVFNALQALVAMPPAPSAAPRPAPPGGAWAGVAGVDHAGTPPVSALYRRAEPDAAATPLRGTPIPPAPHAPVRAAAPAPHAVAGAPVTRAAPREQPAAPAGPAAAVLPPSAGAPMAAAALPGAAPFLASILPDVPSPSPAADTQFGTLPATPPSFMQEPAAAQRKEDPHRPWWTALVVVLALTALLQVLLIARPTLSARSDVARMLLQPLCVLARCNAEAAPRRLAALTVESSALSRLSGDSQRYRLSLVLRNRDVQALRWPAVDLRLTDAHGVLLVRKVLRVRELGASTAALPPGQEQPLQAVLDMGELPVAGYSVELFYP